MLFAKNFDLPILICDKCKGSGTAHMRSCGACKGMGVGYMSEGVFAYFGTPLIAYQVALRRGRRVLNHLRIGVALLVVLSAWGWFGFLIYRNDWLQEILTASFWLDTLVYGKALFWLGVIAIGYLLYRVLNAGKKEEEIPLGLYTADASRAPADTWDAIRRMPRKKRIDIASVSTEPASAVLEDAFVLAKKQGRVFTPLHLFYSLFSSADIASIFLRLGIAKATMQKQVGGLIDKHVPNGVPEATPEIYNVIFNAYELARGFRDTRVRVTELLIATVRQSEPL